MRGPRQWVPLGLGGLLAAAAAVIGWTQGEEKAGPLWVVAAAAFALFLVQAAPAWVKERQATDAAHRREVRAGARGGQLRLVRDTEPGFMSPRRPLIENFPYQTRDVEPEAERILRRGEPLLLLGPAMAGKSQLAEHLITSLYPDKYLWAPADPARLPDLLQSGDFTDAVVALNDLEKYLKVAQLPPDWDLRIQHRGAALVATMRSSEHAEFSADGDVRHPQAEALERLTKVRVRDDDPEENVRLAQAVPTAGGREAAVRVGLGAYLGGGPQAIDRYENNRDKQPLGCAMIRAAADWRRAGLTTITREELIKLAEHYLRDRDRHGEHDPEHALNWATQRVDQLVRDCCTDG